jgi:Mor family transcriptional regulator
MTPAKAGPRKAAVPNGGIDHLRVRNAEIRAMWASGKWTQSAIARKYRLTDTTIWQILRAPRTRKLPDGSSS